MSDCQDSSLVLLLKARLYFVLPTDLRLLLLGCQHSQRSPKMMQEKGRILKSINEANNHALNKNTPLIGRLSRQVAITKKQVIHSV